MAITSLLIGRTGLFLLHVRLCLNLPLLWLVWLPLWSGGQSSWLQIQRFRVRFPVLPDFVRSSGSGTGSTQPHEDN
jgi:hypothetical protein